MIDRLLPAGSRRRRILQQLFEPRVPAELSARQRVLSREQVGELERSLRQHYFTQQAPDYLETGEGQQDLQAHLQGRIQADRDMIVPWLHDLRPLSGMEILEIGCGTGASTIALAEQGANVVGIDIDELALADARKRAQLYGLDIQFEAINCVEAEHYFGDRQFDLIIFWACMEHMTYAERIQAIESTWKMLPTGGLWCITGTPNRLYFHDSHTAMMPFYHWLPDDLAVHYTRFSSRQTLQNAFASAAAAPESETLERLYRWGRGVSYHELELTIAPLADLHVVSDLESHLRRSLLWRLKARQKPSFRYEQLLRQQMPELPVGFAQPYLNVVLRHD